MIILIFCYKWHIMRLLILKLPISRTAWAVLTIIVLGKMFTYFHESVYMPKAKSNSKLVWNLSGRNCIPSSPGCILNYLEMKICFRFKWFRKASLMRNRRTLWLFLEFLRKKTVLSYNFCDLRAFDKTSSQK